MNSELYEIENISPAGLNLLLGKENPPVVLDVREQEERAICALHGSVNIPLNDLPSELGLLNPDHLIVVLCHHGRRSLYAANLLRNNGFGKVVNLAGGIHAWANEVDHEMTKY